MLRVTFRGYKLRGASLIPLKRHGQVQGVVADALGVVGQDDGLAHVLPR